MPTQNHLIFVVLSSLSHIRPNSNPHPRLFIPNPRQRSTPPTILTQDPGPSGTSTRRSLVQNCCTSTVQRTVQYSYLPLLNLKHTSLVPDDQSLSILPNPSVGTAALVALVATKLLVDMAGTVW